MQYRALLTAATLSLVWSAGAQAQAKAPPTVTAHPVVNPAVAQTRAPTIVASSPSSPGTSSNPSSGTSTTAFLPTGSYTLSFTFTKVNGVTETRHAAATVHVTHSGSALTIGSAQTALSGSTTGTHLSLNGSHIDSHVGHVTLTLNGTQATSGASGAITATAPGQSATGTFTLTPTPLATAHMVKVGSFSCDDHCEEIILAIVAICAL